MRPQWRFVSLVKLFDAFSPAPAAYLGNGGCSLYRRCAAHLGSMATVEQGKQEPEFGQRRALVMREYYRHDNLEAVFEEFDPRAFQGECTDAEAMCDLLMAACGKAGDVELASLIKSRMEKTFSRVGRVAHNSMILALCRQGRIKDAADYLAQHVPAEKRQDYNYNTILAACVAQGDTTEFERQLALMKAGGISPTELTWAQIIRKAGLVNAHEVEQIWSEYSSQVDQASYPCLTALVHSLSRCGELKKAARVLREMIALGSVMQQGWKWTKESYIRVGFNSILHSANKIGDLEVFKSILYEMKGAGIEPDKSTYAAIADVAHKAGGAKDLQEVVAHMLKTGSIPGGHIYIRIIKGMTDSGEKDKAMKTWKQMMSMGILPSIYLFNQILEACAIDGDLDQAMDVYDTIKFSKCIPDNYTYSALFKVVANRAKKAQKLSVAASSKSRDEKARAYTAANHDKANCASVLKEWEKSMLKTNKIPHNEASITALVMAYGRVGLPDEVLRVLNSAVTAKKGEAQAGLQAFNSAIAALSRAGKVHAARALVNRVAELRLGPTVETYNSYLLACGQKGGPRVIDVLAEMEKAGIQRDAVTYDVLTVTSCTPLRPQYGLKWVREMKRKGFEPSLDTWTKLLTKLARYGTAELLNSALDLMDNEQKTHFSDLVQQKMDRNVALD